MTVMYPAAFNVKEEIVSIQEASHGELYHCPACKERMIARLGEINQHHFAHYSPTQNCSQGYETILHLMAKKILENHYRIKLPGWTVPAYRSSKLKTYSKDYWFSYDSVAIEKRYNDFIPDIQLRKGDKIVFVEIAVSHKVDKEKFTKLRESGIATVEIDLSWLNQLFGYSELEEAILSNTEAKEWVYHPILTEALLAYYQEKEACEQLEAEEWKRQQELEQKKKEEEFEKLFRDAVLRGSATLREKEEENDYQTWLGHVSFPQVLRFIGLMEEEELSKIEKAIKKRRQEIIKEEKI